MFQTFAHLHSLDVSIKKHENFLENLIMRIGWNSQALFWVLIVCSVSIALLLTKWYILYWNMSACMCNYYNSSGMLILVKQVWHRRWGRGVFV